MGCSRRRLQGTGPAFCPESICSPHHPRKGILGLYRHSESRDFGRVTPVPHSPASKLRKSSSSQAPLGAEGRACGETRRALLWDRRLLTPPPGPLGAQGPRIWKVSKSQALWLSACTHTLTCTQPTLSPTLTRTSHILTQQKPQITSLGRSRPAGPLPGAWRTEGDASPDRQAPLMMEKPIMLFPLKHYFGCNRK